MKVFNLSSDEEIEINHGSPKFAVQWCESVRQSRSLEFAAMSEAERDQEFPVTEGSISISCGDYCTQIKTMNRYSEWGSRKAYLGDLADQYGVDVQVVFMLALLLGPDEDFDGLVVEVEDYSLSQ